MNIDENEFFRQAVLRICRNLDLEISLQECLLYLRSYMPADMFHLNIHDPGLGAIRNIAMATDTEAKRTNIMVPLDEASRAQFEKPAPSTFILDQPQSNLFGKAFSSLEGMWFKPSAMVMQLEVKNFRPGNLILYAEGKNRFTEKHRQLFSMLNEPFTIALSNSMRYDELIRLKDILADDLQYLHQKLLHSTDRSIVGEKFGLRTVVDMVKNVAPMDSPVLLLGETGVGKEIIANAVHTMSRRSKGAFIKVNCGAIAETLIDSELFGHEKGAFTGAVAQKRGCFERAGGGTIFLDEVAELPLQAQVRMLRVLQEKKIVRVGGSEEVDVDIRIIAATHQNLETMVEKKLFRADLQYRLNVFPISIPPLRERLDDIPGLVHYFISKKSEELRIHEPPKVSPGAIDALQAYNWPGNVRELENVVERALILDREGPLTFNDIVWTKAGGKHDDGGVGDSIFPTLDFINARHIREALKIANGKVHGPQGAAALLGVNPSTLRHRMRKLGLYHTKKSSF